MSKTAGADHISAVNVLAHGNMVPVPGGLLIRDKDKTVLGAIGVSGDISDIDESCAINGIGCAVCSFFIPAELYIW